MLLSDWDFVVTQLPVIVTIGIEEEKTSSATDIVVENVRLKGITFAHTTTLHLLEQYIVPSAGYWSVVPKRAVTISGTTDIVLDHCTWRQCIGNCVALHGKVHDLTISPTFRFFISNSKIANMILTTGIVGFK